ncbi:MAG: phage major capsid protein [Alphaproteobacteria bacterium]
MHRTEHNEDFDYKSFSHLVAKMGKEVLDFKDSFGDRIETIEKVISRPEASHPDSAISVKGNNQMKAFGKFLRTGDEHEMKAMSVGSDPDGGYLVLPTRSNRMVSRLFDTSPMRSVCAIETISTDALEMLNDTTELTASWVSETASRAVTATSQLGKYNIPTHEMYTSPKATQKIIDDGNISIENWLLDKTDKVFTRKENDAFVNGDGVGKPRGFLTYTTSTSGDSSRAWGQIQYVPSGTSAAVNADSLLDLMYALKADYRPGAVWMMPRAIANTVRKQKDGNGQYLWQPGLSGNEPDRLLGFPLLYAEDMPAAAANSLSIAFGNFKEAYTIVDRAGIRVLRDPYTDKPNVIFYTTKRVGGAVVNFDAIKLLKLSIS